MSEELEIFLEDCEDQLQMMENALVDMQNNGATEDSIGAIFRAAHTIKGSAGMFGFDEIVAFTHIAENLFERIREGAIEVTADMVDLFLLCKDHIDKLIAVQTDEQELDDAQKAVGDDLVKKLTSYMSSQENQEKETQDTELIEEELDVSSDIENITDFTIYEVEKLQNHFLKELEINNEFILDMKLIKKIDMVGIQLLLSLVKSAHVLNKKVEFINISEDILQEIKICHCNLALGITDE